MDSLIVGYTLQNKLPLDCTIVPPPSDILSVSDGLPLLRRGRGLRSLETERSSGDGGEEHR